MHWEVKSQQKYKQRCYTKSKQVLKAFHSLKVLTVNSQNN